MGVVKFVCSNCYVICIKCGKIDWDFVGGLNCIDDDEFVFFFDECNCFGDWLDCIDFVVG